MLDHWPLFAPKMVETLPVTCPIIGGYNMVITGSKEDICKETCVLPLMEIKC